MDQSNIYHDLSTYSEIYQELIYQRNEAVRWLTDHGMLDRNRRVTQDQKDELLRHRTAFPYRSVFRQNILDLLDRLYSHDAVEALYDFNSVDLKDWSDTEANRLERELQRLQLIIGKLELRYNLQYRMKFSYDSENTTLFLNNIEVLTCGQNTLRHRILTTLFSDPHKQWQNDLVEQYFIDHFDYSEGQLQDKSIEKTANDLRRDVAAKTAAKDFLLVSNSSIKLNPAYIA